MARELETAYKLKFYCESYIKRNMLTHRFDLPDFVGYMEPIFRRLGYRTMDQKRRENILVIRLDGIGNCVLVSGFLRELRKNKPKAHITLVVNPAAYPLVECCPYVDKVIAFASGAGTAFQDIFRSAVDFCYRHLWKYPYDVCFCPQWGVDRSWTLLLSFISGARERIGYSEKVHQEKARTNRGHDMFLSRAVIGSPEVVHETARAFFLLKEMGAHVTDDSLELWFDEQDENVAMRLLINFMEKNPMVVVALGAGQACRKYPVEQYVKAFLQIAESGAGFILLGGGDADLESDFFVRHMPRNTVLNLVGQVSLRVMAAVISKADLYIGNGLDIAQMAAAFRVPVIGVLPEAVDKKEDKAVYSLYERFYPWKTPAIVLRPDHALPPCDETAVLGGCCTMMPHCICRIPPENIVEAYCVMMGYLRNHR